MLGRKRKLSSSSYYSGDAVSPPPPPMITLLNQQEKEDGGALLFSWERLQQTLAGAYRERFDALPTLAASRKTAVEEEPGAASSGC